MFRPTLLFIMPMLGTPVLVNAQVANAGPDTSICGDTFTMQGSPVPIGAIGTWTLVSGCGTSTNANDPVQQVVGLCVGTSIWEWSVDDGGSITTDMVGITSWDPSFPNANAGPDQIVPWSLNDAILSASPSSTGPAVCWWEIVAGNAYMPNSGDANTLAMDMPLGTTVFCWSCINGPCGTTSDTVVVEVVTSMGIAALADDPRSSFTWDASERRLTFTGQGLLTDLLVVDTQGRTLLADHGAMAGRSWSMHGMANGVVLLRAMVDGQPKVWCFAAQ